MAVQSAKEEWDASARRLQGRLCGADTDELIDELAATAIDFPTADAIDALLTVLSLAKSSLTKKSVALAIAVSAGPGMPHVLDALVAQYRDRRDDAFLAPAILDALYVLACRDTLARTELSSVVQRIDRTENAFLVAKAATISGRLLQRQMCPELQTKLRELSDAPDGSAAAEARFHIACIELHDVLTGDDRCSILEALRKAATSFMSVELADESRPDAHVMGRLLELFLAVAECADESDVDTRIAGIRTTFDSLPFWSGYGSPSFTIFISQAWRTVEALIDAQRSVGESRRWLDIRAALLKLSTTMDVLTCCTLGEQFALLSADMSRLSDIFVSPKIGAVLVRQIGRERVQAAIEEAAQGGAPGTTTLKNLADLLDLAETDPQLLSEKAIHCLRQLHADTGRPPDLIIEEFADAVSSGDVGPWIEGLAPGRVSLPIYPSEPYGADPAVHAAVCEVLEQLRRRLAPYDLRRWVRLVEVVVFIVQFAHRVRDELPEYCLCGSDKGQGQSASENDLQRDLFRDLRRQYGQRCVYEHGPIAGGRADSGIRFDEVEFPIETKHEFQHVDRSHIRENYLTQPSDYAGARQRVSFLLILDLRAANAVAHRDYVNEAKKAGKDSGIRSLYTLKESFWCESLPVDVEIDSAQPNVIVVGLFPGNRPRPSSQTRYSKRPKAASRRRGR